MPSQWPEVPRTMYLGCDNNNLLKVLPFAPEHADEEWAQPYSVRSFVAQASVALQGCWYRCWRRGEVYDETIFNDRCGEEPWGDDVPWDEDRSHHECHVLAGWSAGKSECPLGKKILALCDTDAEREFLRVYLRYVKHRQFPMLLPQARIGIAERRRPDFVAFVPIQHWRYKWVVVELDAAHPESAQADDAARNQYYADSGYEVISLRQKSYFKAVQALVEQFENWMNMAKTDDEWEVAIELPVRSHTAGTPLLDDDIPF